MRLKSKEIVPKRASTNNKLKISVANFAQQNRKKFVVKIVDACNNLNAFHNYRAHQMQEMYLLSAIKVKFSCANEIKKKNSNKIINPQNYLKQLQQNHLDLQKL